MGVKKDRWDKIKEVHDLGASKRCHNSWKAMWHRCNSEKATYYALYGGRGIKVCKRWSRGRKDRNGFLNFYKDMGNPPEGHSLNRIDPNKDYKPSNCQWSTFSEQTRNQRTRKAIESFTHQELTNQLTMMDPELILETTTTLVKSLVKKAKDSG